MKAAADRRGEKQVVFHLMQVDSLVISVVAALTSALAYLVVYLAIGSLHVVTGKDSPLDLSGGVIVSVSSFVATLVATALFNFVAPRLGGVRLWLSEQPDDKRSASSHTRTPAATDLLVSAGTSERKPCPACGAKIRADRSFCPECDHIFEDEDDS